MDDRRRNLKVKGKSESEMVMISSCCRVALVFNIWKDVMSLLNQHLKRLSLFQGCACYQSVSMQEKDCILEASTGGHLIEGATYGRGLKKQSESARCAGSSSGPEGEEGAP